MVLGDGSCEQKEDKDDECWQKNDSVAGYHAISTIFVETHDVARKDGSKANTYHVLQDGKEGGGRVGGKLWNATDNDSIADWLGGRAKEKEQPCKHDESGEALREGIHERE